MEAFRMTTTHQYLFIAALVAAVHVPDGGQTASTPGRTAQTPGIDVQKLGPQVGERVLDFSLPDQRGETRTLQSLMGPKGAVIVFFRSADW